MRARLEERKRVRGKVNRKVARKLKKGYNHQACYLIQAYSPEVGAPVRVIPVRTLPTFEVVLRDFKEEGLLPLILPQPVYVPKEFWEEYRHASDEFDVVELVKKYGLLKDSSIWRFDTVVLDIDSPFELVYPAWLELREELSLQVGYQVYKTKSGRFRAYIYLLTGTRDFVRARELVAILYAFFESKGFNADKTFIDRLNHPVFYEEFSLYNYKLVEEAEGRIANFFELYRKVKALQKKLKLYTFKGRNLTEWFWDKKITKEVRRRVEKTCKILKAPAFVRALKNNRSKVIEHWKKAVATLSAKHDSYRYIYVIQPAVGWAKYLELPREEVEEFLVSLLGEEKRKDIEKAYKYARELEFNLPKSWAGKTREEWEREALSYLLLNGSVSRQDFIKNVFYKQKWLCDEIMASLMEKGLAFFFFEIYGRGRPRKVFSVADELRMPLRKAVGCELIIQERLELSPNCHIKQKFVVEERDDFSQIKYSLFEGVMGGGWNEKTKFTGKGGITPLRRCESPPDGPPDGRERESGRVQHWSSIGENVRSLTQVKKSNSTRPRSSEIGDRGQGAPSQSFPSNDWSGEEEYNELVELWEKGIIEF